MTGPWKPFAAYRAGDKTLFFGRDREADALVELILGERRAALLFGEAGVGKSSLAQAGLGPRLRARNVEMVTVDCASAKAIDLPGSPSEGVAVIEEPDAALTDRASAARLVEVLQRGAQAGWRFLFVADDEALGRILPLEERIGALFGPGGRLRLERFDAATAGEVIEQTFLGSGAYVEAGLSQAVAEDLTARGAVSPSLLQVVCAQATEERVTTAEGYRKSGGAEQLLFRFLARSCAAAGDGAERVLSEVASRERRAILSVDALAYAVGIAPTRVEKLVDKLATAKLLTEGAGGVGLGSEWLRARAQEFVAETRGKSARVRRMLDLKVARRGLLLPRQVREVRRFAGGLDDDQTRIVARSKMVFRALVAACVILPLSGAGVVWRGYGKRFVLDENGGEIVARLGPKSAPLGFLPRSPALGTIVGASGLSRAAFAVDPSHREGVLDGDRWMHEAEGALLPLPHGITALALDGEVTALQTAAADPALLPRVLEVLAVLGTGGAAERNLLDQALADKSEEVRRRALSAAATLEARVPGATGNALDAALDDKAPSVRAAALEAAIGRGAATVLARALGSSDPATRKRAAAALAPMLKDRPEAVPSLVAALAGPGRSEAEPLAVALVEGNGPAATAMVAALAQVAADPKGDTDGRIAALRLLRHAPSVPADPIEKALAGPPKVAGAALPLLARVDPARALARLADARGPVPVRAGAAAALAFLPKDPDTPKRLKAALSDGAAEVRAEAVRASPLLGREAIAILAKVLRGEQAEVERAAVETLGASKLGGEAVDLLSQLAQKGKPALRKPAIDALASLKAVGALTALTRAKEPETRRLAALALGPSPQLRALAKDPDPSVRKAAVQALGGAKNAAGAKALAAFLGDGEADVRAAAATALGAIGASDTLVVLLTDKEPAVRAAARRGLAANPTTKPSADLERALGRAFSDGDSEERGALAELAAGAPAILRRAAADADPSVRKAAARAAGAGKANDLLRLLAGDSDREVRAAAVAGLSANGAVAELQAVLAVEPDPAVRAAAIAALPDGEAARVLREKALADPSEQIRAAAARGLGGAGAGERAQLQAALRDPAADVRAAAVEALGRVAAADAVDDLARQLLASEADADGRWATAEALARKASVKATATAALAALDSAATHGPAGARIAARVARGFAGRADDMHPFVVAYRRGR